MTSPIAGQFRNQAKTQLAQGLRNMQDQEISTYTLLCRDIPVVTYRMFSRLMEKRKRSIDDLVDLFRGKIEDPRSFFERVFEARWRNPETRRYEDRSGVVIPYRSVLKFYLDEAHYQELLDTGK